MDAKNDLICIGAKDQKGCFIYSKSGGRCERLGLQVQLPKSHEEQIFIDTIPSYSSNWLRIQFDTNQIISDDEFRGEILTSLPMASSRQSSLVTLKLKCWRVDLLLRA